MCPQATGALKKPGLDWVKSSSSASLFFLVYATFGVQNESDNLYQLPNYQPFHCDGIDGCACTLILTVQLLEAAFMNR